MARITRFLSLRKQFILNRSNVRFATIQIPDPTKIVASTNDIDTKNNKYIFPTSVDSFISWSKIRGSKSRNYMKVNRKKNQKNQFEIVFHEARPGEKKDKYLFTTSPEKFTKVIQDFRPNNFCTLSPANRRKGTRS